MFKRIKRLFTIVIILGAIVLLVLYGSQGEKRTNFTVYLDQGEAEYRLPDLSTYQPLATGISPMYNGTYMRTKDAQLYLFFDTDVMIVLDKYSEIRITSTSTQTVINQLAGQSWSQVKATVQYQIVADPYIITATDTSFNLQQLPNQDWSIAVTSGEVIWQQNTKENVAGSTQVIPQNKLVTLSKELIAEPLSVNLTAQQYDMPWFKINKIIADEFTTQNPSKALLTRLAESLDLKGPTPPPPATTSSINESNTGSLNFTNNQPPTTLNQAIDLTALFNQYNLSTIGDQICQKTTSSDLIKDLATITDQNSDIYNYLLSLQTFCQDNILNATEKVNLNNIIKTLTAISSKNNNYQVDYQSALSFNLNVKGVNDPVFQKAIKKILQKYTTITGDGRQICQQYKDKNLKDIYQEISQVESQYNYSPRAATQFTNILAGISMACENGIISDVEKQSLLIIGP